jgi:hypothetical protein
MKKRGKKYKKCIIVRLHILVIFSIIDNKNKMEVGNI